MSLISSPGITAKYSVPYSAALATVEAVMKSDSAERGGLRDFRRLTRRYVRDQARYNWCQYKSKDSKENMRHSGKHTMMGRDEAR